MSEIRSVSNALRILEVFSSEPGEFGANDLARRLSLSPSVVFRLLKTLGGRGFLEQDAKTRRFNVGTKALRLGLRFADRHSFASGAAAALREAFPEYTRYVAMLAEDQMLVLSAEEGHGPVRIGARIGERRYLHTTALGKAVLSTLTDSQVDEIIDRTGLPRVTAKTITSRRRLRDDVRRTRARGYSVTDEEGVIGVLSVGAPVRNERSGGAPGALSVSIPKYLMTPGDIDAVGTAVARIAARFDGGTDVRPTEMTLSTTGISPERGGTRRRNARNGKVARGARVRVTGPR